jgi:hypothetical protein
VAFKIVNNEVVENGGDGVFDSVAVGINDGVSLTPIDVLVHNGLGTATLQNVTIDGATVIITGVGGLFTTDDITEGTSNLFYTDARAQAVSINSLFEDPFPMLSADLDAGDLSITSVLNIGFNTITANPIHAEGCLFYDTVNKALSYYNDNVDVTVNLGREQLIRVVNNTAGIIVNGSVCRVSGSDGTVPEVSLSQADTIATSTVAGIATHDIGIGEYGYITVLGTVRGLSTSLYNAGDAIYLSDTLAGNWTTTPPTFPSYVVELGVVSKVDAADGEVEVRIHSHAFENLQVDGAADFEIGLNSHGDIDMLSNSIVNVAAPANPNDAVNKNYVDGLVSSGLGALTTDDVAEATNLYYTDARSRAAISVTGTGSYDSINGVIDIQGGVTSVNTQTGDVVLSSTEISEGTNLYYTDSRVDTRFDTRLALKSTTDLTEGLNLYYTNARSRSAISVTGTGSYDSINGVIDIQGGVTSVNTQTGDVLLTTNEISEGTNLYYTDTRFDNRLSLKTTADLTEGSNLYYTTARFDSRLALKTTTDLAEGTNLYYTTARFDTRFDSRLALKSTDNIAEGLNLYYTDARARSAITVTGSGSYDSVNGIIDIQGGVTSVNTQTGDVVLTTSEITEGSNLYYTTSRFDTRFDSRLALKSTTDLTEGTNLYYTSTRFDNDFVAKSTSDLSEGTNLYYTDTRFDSRLALKTTSNLTEGSNLYYTAARFDAALASKSTTNLAEGTNLYYTDTRFDTRLAAKSTTNLTEGSNLYYTTARANSAIDTRVNASFVNALNVTAAAVQPNSVTLGTGTTGNYVATITGTGGEIDVTGSGTETAAITLSLPTEMVVPQNLTVTGNLTVNGTTITNDTSTVAVNDPYVTVGGSTPLSADDNKDRGVRFRWHDGAADTTAGSFVTGHVYIITATGTTNFTLIGAADSNPGTVFTATGPGTGTGTANDEVNTHLGFFGFDDSDNSFFYIPDATETGETFAGTIGNAKFTTVTADLTGNVTGNTAGTHTGAVVGNASTATALQTARTFSLAGDVITASPVSFNGTSDIVLNTTIQPNSVALGTDTSGNYVSTITAGTGIVVSGSGVETAAVTVTHADTSTQASVNNSNGVVIQDITLDDFGHITALGSLDLDTRYYTETEADARFVNTAGDTMTGALTLSADPTALLHAATKQYVDAQVTSGVVTSANKWTTARLITLGGDATGSVSIDGSANVTLTVAVADDSHNHIISNVDGLQAALDGKLDTTHDMTLTLSGDATGSATFTDMGNATLTVVIADDSHNHIISNVDGLQAALDLKLDATHDMILTLAGDATGSATFTDMGNATLTVAVADNSHNHTIANVTGLQTALDSKLASTHDMILTLAGDATGSATFTDMGNATLTVAVLDDSHTHDGRYYTETEADARFVNTAGDTLTGFLTLNSDPTALLHAASKQYVDAQILSGVVTSAGKWTTARSISLGGDATGSVSIDGSSNVTLTVAVVDDSHTHDGRYYTETEADARFINTAGDTLTGFLTLNADPTALLHAATKQYVDAQVTSGVVTSANKWTTARSITLAGDATGSVSIDGSANVTLTVAVVDDSHNHDGRYYTETESDARFANVSGDTFTGNVTAPTFIGALSGNATSATSAVDATFATTAAAAAVANKWTTARSITLAGDATGSVSIDGSANVTLTVAVVDNSHAHTIANVTGLQAALDSKLALTGGTMSGSLTIGTIVGSAVGSILNVTGNIVATGDVTAYSDRSLKDNIVTIDSALDKVSALRGVYFDKDGKASTGVIAQEVEEVLPEVVHTQENGLKSVAYGNMVGLLIEAVKELTEQNKQMASEIARLNDRLNN